MREVVTSAPSGAFEVVDADAPDKRAGSVLVDMRLALLTPADASWWADGPAESFPLRQGGGGAGMLATGGGALVAGSRVVIRPEVACRTCTACRASKACIDPQLIGRDRPGTLAEQLVVPRTNVTLVPEGLLPGPAAAAVDYARAWAALEHAPASPKRMLLLGDERLLELASARFPRAEIAREPDDGAFPFIVSSGAPALDLQDSLAPGGILVLGGPPPTTLTVDVERLANEGQRVIGSAGAGPRDLAGLLRWMRDNEFEPELGDVHGFDAVDRALAEVQSEGRSAAVLIE